LRGKVHGAVKFTIVKDAACGKQAVHRKEAEMERIQPDADRRNAGVVSRGVQVVALVGAAIGAVLGCWFGVALGQLSWGDSSPRFAETCFLGAAGAAFGASVGAGIAAVGVTVFLGLVAVAEFLMAVVRAALGFVRGRSS
jgi:hypothetical protein